jgi:cell division protein FtsQ
VRQVKVTRSAPRASRSKSGRKPARAESRGSRETQRSFGRRKPPSIFRRLSESIRGWIGFRRPMLMLAAGVLAFTAVGTLIVGGYIGAAVATTNATLAALIHDAGFGISAVNIDGNVRTPPESITAALGFEPDQSIFSADLITARQRLLRLPWVADAQVLRRYPDAITVSLIEKLPYALWRTTDGRVFAVERNGRLITDSGVEQFVKLPHLIGDAAPQNAAEIVEAVAQVRAIAARMSAYERVSDRRWNLVLDDGVVVKLPEKNWQKELTTLEHLIIDKGVLERDITEIDLRSKNAIFFMLKSGEQKSTVRGDKI